MTEPVHDIRRFTPSKESLGHMKMFRDKLPFIKEQIPEVRGLGFFGSRTLGRERTDPSKPSDLDVVIFYDGSKFEIDESSFTIVENDGKLLPDAGKRVQELAAKRQHADAARNTVLAKSKQAVTDLMKKSGLPIDYDDETGQNKTIFTIDISQVATDRAIDLLVMYVDANANSSTDRVRPGDINDVTFTLASRFLLGVGEGLYQNRSYILNTLGKMENGENYFQGLMICLKGVQRVEDQQGKAPNTISQAKSYFMIQ